MNRFQFEEVLFDALYAPMRAAWDAMEADDADDAIEIEDILLEDDTQFPLDC